MDAAEQVISILPLAVLVFFGWGENNTGYLSRPSSSSPIKEGEEEGQER